MKWKEIAINQFYQQIQLANDEDILYTIQKDSPQLHLAIFVEPFLSLIFQKEKTIESRFSVNKIDPYQKTRKGDIVLMKKSGGMICGYFTVAEIIYFANIDKTMQYEIEYNYGNEICTSAHTNFWEERKSARFATLIKIDKVFKLSPYQINKKDRRGWIILPFQDTLIKHRNYENYFSFNNI